ncbi:Protein TRANSPARENT TESTA 12 [Hordeum vulgare]|nr:Protein TRANSPARENT TESTA 12 [Hordeum vulgare]
MLTRCRGSSGYRGVRERPSIAFCAEIPSGDVRLGLVTFETTYQATRAYDTAAWRLQRPRAQMNFHDVRTCEQSHGVAPPPHFITEHDCEEHRRRQRRLLIAEADEQAMAELRQRYPQDIARERLLGRENDNTPRGAGGQALAESTSHITMHSRQRRLGVVL